LKIGASTIEAGASDNIRDTIDYAEVVGYFQAHLSQRHFNLLESLAEFVATTLIERYGARQVRVSAAKIGAMRDVGRVGVIIERCAKTRETAELAPIDCRENGAPHAPLRASTPFSVDK
jgi:dihydroneopterin aldolase